MKVIICGAGEVGFNIARYLASEAADITVIDQRPDLIRTISDSLDVNAMVGHASHPEVLERAGAADSDILIAVTYADEVNMVACQVAHSLFGLPTKIARIRAQTYLQPMWADLFSRDNIPIDVIISPEIEVAQAVTRRLEVPGTLEVVPLAEDKVKFIGVRCTEETPIVNTPLRQLTELFPELQIVIVGIRRNEHAIIPKADEHLLPGDDVYFVVATDQTKRALASFGHEEPEARRALILGGGNIGMFLAQELEEKHPEITLKLIELNRERAEFVAKGLQQATVLNGDVLDPDLLIEAGVDKAETCIAVTNEDETNILASLLAKRYGSQRTVGLLNKSTYNPIVNSLGIDVVVNPRATTVSKVLQHVRRGRIHSVHSMQEDFGELIEADAMETSPLVGQPLKEANLPRGVRIGSVVRGDKVISPRGDTIIEAGDRIVLFAATSAVKKVEKLFSVRLEYF